MEIERSPRRTINSAVLVLAVVVVIFAAAWSWWVYGEYRLTQRARLAGDLESQMLEAGRLFAVERGYTNAFTNLAGAEGAALQSQIGSLRRLADEAWERAYDTAQQLIELVPNSTILQNELEDTRLIYWDIQNARQAVDAGAASHSLITHSVNWFRLLTGFIDHMTLLRNAAASLSNARSDDEALWILRGWLWLASEYAGQERARVAEYIAKREPIPKVLKDILVQRAETTEHLIAEFIDLSTPYLNQDDELVAANRQMLVEYLGRYTPLRQHILASQNGVYPLRVAEWLKRATTAIDTLHATADALTARIDRGLDWNLRYRFWQLLIAALLLVVTLVAVVIAVYRVNQTAERLVKQRRLAEHRLDEVNNEMAARARAEEDLRASEQRIKLVMDSVPASIAFMDSQLYLRFLNRHVSDLFGVDPVEFLDRHLSELIGTDAFETVRPHHEKALAGESVSYERFMGVVNGRPRWVQVDLVPNVTAVGSVEGLYALATDISEHRSLEEALRGSKASFHSLVELNAIGIVVMDAQHHVLFTNAAAESMLGSGSEILKRFPLIPGRVTELPIQSAGRAKGVAEVNVSHTDWEGSAATLLMLEDVTARKEAQRAAEFLTQHDGLTGLPNRNLFKDRLELALRRTEKQQSLLALLVVDIDRFSRINDVYGTEAGDHILAEAAWGLSSAVRDYDTVARMSADQFVIVLEDLENPEDIRRMGEQILQRFRQPSDIDGKEVRTTVSIGAAAFPLNASSPDDLQHCAFAALRVAKKAGGDAMQFYEPHMDDILEQHLRLESDLSHAVERNELELHYQPRINAQSGAVEGMEALLRWRHRELGMISPAEFIPLAETSGLIVPIGRWVLEEACRQTKAWSIAELPWLKVSVNLSAVQFARDDLVEMVTSVLQSTGLPAAQLELEITESILMQNAESAASVLARLRDHGVSCSVDDFGTGYSSLGYLRHFPLHALKIDRSFVRTLPNDPEDAAITGAVISIARDLRLKVVAEGVEYPEQAAFLRLRGCDEFQGFLFSKPLPGQEFEQLLRQRARFPIPGESEREEGRTVLVLDDDVNVLQALKRELRRSGFKILIASKPEEAMGLLAMHQVGVVLCDLRMPLMSGVEFMRRCRQMYPEATRVMMSGYTDLDSLLETINEGAVFKFIVKPWKGEQLQELLREAFGYYDTIRENERLRRHLRANAITATES